MANDVWVSSFTSAGGTAVPIYCENIGGTNFVQAVKLVGGQAGSTQQIPGDSNQGLYVQYSSGYVPNVAVSSMPAVSGTVTVQGSVSVSGVAQVSGTVSVSGVADVAVSITGTTAGAGQALQGSTASVASGVFGLIVRVADSAVVAGTVSIANLTTNVTGTVSLSGTGLVSVVPGVSVTIQQGASVSLPGLSGVIASSVPATSNAFGLPVWIVGGQTATGAPLMVTVTSTALVSIVSTAIVSVVPGLSVSAQISGTVSLVTVSTVGTLVTLLGTVAVNVVAGGAGGGSVTTAAPSISASGQVMWMAGGQGTTANPVYVSIVPSAQISGTITINNGASVTIQQGASVSFPAVSGVVASSVPATSNAFGLPIFIVGGQTATGVPVMVTVTSTALVSVVGGASIATVSGTVNVNIVAGAAGGGSVTTAAPSISATGQVIWVAGGQSSTADPVFVSVLAGSINIVNAISGTVAISGTGLVSVVPGLSVSAVVSGTVSVLGAIGVTTQTSVSVTGLPVWFAPGALVSLSGTGVVSVVPGLSVSAVVSGTLSIANVVPVTTAASVSVTGLPVWLNPTQTIAVSGAVSAVTTQTAVTGAPVWLAPSQSITVGPSAGTPVLIMISSTVVGSSTTMLFTVQTGVTSVTAGTSAWAVPSGKTFRIRGINVIAVSSAVLGQAQFVIIAGTAAASLTVTATVGIAAVLPYAIQGTTVANWIGAMNMDVLAGTTICPAIMLGTSQSIIGAAIQGYLY